jgi:hypothetical protein
VERTGARLGEEVGPGAAAAGDAVLSDASDGTESNEISEEWGRAVLLVLLTWRDAKRLDKGETMRSLPVPVVV